MKGLDENTTHTTDSAERRATWIKIDVSIWLTTLIVIILILLLAVTINRSREKDVAEQFGSQQLAIAKETTARIDDFLAFVTQSMVLTTRLSRSGDDETTRLKTIHDIFGGDVSFIRLGADCKVLAAYPRSLHPVQEAGIDAHKSFFAACQRAGSPLIGEMTMNDSPSGVGRRSVVIGVPDARAERGAQGITVAAIPFPALIKRYFTSATPEIAGRYHGIVDSRGTVVIHPDTSLIGRDASVLEDAPSSGRTSLREALLAGSEGYGEFLVRKGKETERSIVVYAPIHTGTATWSMVMFAPYRTVVSPVRNAFVNIMIGTIGLIVVAVIGGLSLSLAGRRRLHLQQELRRLRERNDWQDKLLREKKTIEGIIEGSPIPTFVIDRDHRIIFWNKACADLTGYEGGDMIGTSNQHLPFYPDEKRPVLADLIIDQDAEDLQKYYGKKRVTKSQIIRDAYEAGAYFENLGGRGRHLYFLAAPIYDDGGEIIAAIETLQDVSRQEEMDQNLREYAETLQNELVENINLRQQVESLYNYLQSLLDSSPDQLFDLNSDGTIHFMSRDLQRGRNLVSPQIRGKNINEFIDPDNREILAERWKRFLKGNFEPYEIESRAKDGSKRYFFITPRPIEGTDRFLFVQRDITEFKNLQEKYYESEKLAAVGQLSAGIAHEIRNPLSSIKMSLQILEKRMQPEGNDLKRFRIAQREVEHLEQLVNDVLIYARPATPQKKPTELRRIIEHVLAMAEKEITDKKIVVQTLFEDLLPPLLVDDAMIEQAFLNLIRNALEAMPEGGRLRIAARRSGEDSGRAAVEIEDNGCGIDEKDMPHIFNPFFTTKSSGTGLGLTPVKKIVESHDGDIEILSKKGEGTRVVVSLPLEEADSAGKPSSSSPAAT